MRFGLSGLESSDGRGLGELAQLADRLGFEALLINEEHFQRPVQGRGRRCLSPVVLAAHLAGLTERIRLGFSVLLLPLHHPIRLAEELATLDVVSGGRVDVRVSRGASTRYRQAFGLGVPDGVSLQDGLSSLLDAWTSDTVPTSDGPLPVEPKPVQQPHPPVYVGTYTPATVRWAAGAGHGLIVHGIQSLSNVRATLHTYATAGGDPATVPAGSFVYVADDDATARRDLWPVVVQLTDRLRQAGIHHIPNVLDEADLEPARFYQRMTIAGGPESCVQRLTQLRDQDGVHYVNCLSAFFGYLPEPLLRRSLTLLGTTVMPALTSPTRPSSKVTPATVVRAADPS